MQCAPYLIRKIKYCIMFCWAWYTCCSLKKVPMATWRSRKPQARHRVKYPRCCQWWLMSSSRLKFHERDFARRHRRRGEYSVCSGQAKSMKLQGFLSIQHFTRKEKKIDSWGDVWMIRGDRNRVAGSRPGVASCLAWSCGVHVANQTAWSCCTVTPCPCKTEQASNHLTDVKKIWAAIMQLRKQPEDNILHFAIKKTYHFVFYIFAFLEGNLQYLKY